MRSSTISIILLMFLIGLSIYAVWPKHSDQSSSTESKLDSLNQAIKQHEQQEINLLYTIDSLKYQNMKLRLSYDSLETVKTQIQIRYHEVYKYIDHASNAQLDTLIRQNW